MITRQHYEVNTDTGTWGDTGPPAHGAVLQMRWYPTTGDTGADLQITLMPKAGDTGHGWFVYNDNDVMGTQFVKCPSQPQHSSAGAALPADTGAQFGVPIVLAGDRPRVKVIPGGAAVVGDLYLWIGE
jgi:hypothetical protein